MTGVILVIFILGYLAIAFEQTVKINKAASALVTGTLCWTIYILTAGNSQSVNIQLQEHIGEIAGILFFLLGAMTVVELIDAHDGFEIITQKISSPSKRKLLWTISWITFFLSAVLDNLTTTIVMISLLRKLTYDRNDRLLFSGMIVIAANAGGAWSPIGDVTTTMLWIGNQITPFKIIYRLFPAAAVCLLIPLLALSTKVKGLTGPLAEIKNTRRYSTSTLERNAVFLIGLGILIFVPVFKTLTDLPPYMGMLFGLGIIWIVTELIHAGKNEEDKHPLSVIQALRKIDVPSILFFLGILVSISALQATGMLSHLANWLTNTIASDTVTVISIGLLSAIVDNVPLVAAVQRMYDLTHFPTDHYFWEFLAYSAGNGGSILIIGSAAGVAAMGMEKIDFFWYLKRISFLALIGFFAGAVVYIIQYRIFGQ